MAEVLRNPDKLVKSRKELSQTVGKYVTVVKETLRLHPPGPLLVPHKCDEMVSISSFNVPKNAQILVNVWAMGRDPTIWENPTIFMPERFLKCEVDFKGHDFELIPYGAGKRICPGLPLAHRTMHLIVASLVHNFEWKLADGLMPEHISMKDQFGLTLKKVQPLRNLWTSYDFKLSSITTIIISSPQVGKQVLHENGQVFSSRTIPHSLHALDHHKYSVVFMPPSPKWRNLRRVCATKIFSPQVLDSTQILRQQIAILDLLVGGIDTTSNTVEWMMAELLRNPGKIDKRKELSQAIGKDVTIEESHILKLPFLRAVVKETLRLHPPGPFLVPHKCDEMVTIYGFKVPKNAQVLVNVWAMGRDPRENPEVFKPERFLEREIDFKGHDFEFIPCGTGNRIAISSQNNAFNGGIPCS
ncbi:Geraniol 8-hydroxylase [Glycine max]|nr:Geraniol 8-hydroxylase [Glycine max]